MTATINVTQQDIARGISGECESCPVALAMSRHFEMRVYVSSKTYLLERPGERHHHKPLPDSAVQFIRDFDYGLSIDVRPFAFQIEV